MRQQEVGMLGRNPKQLGMYTMIYCACSTLEGMAVCKWQLVALFLCALALSFIFMVLAAKRGILLNTSFDPDSKSDFLVGKSEQPNRVGKRSQNGRNSTLSLSSVDRQNEKPVHSVCKDKRCTSLISSIHLNFYKICEAMAFSKTHVDPFSIPTRCTFRENKGHVPVALVSVPGSGNTWIRGLLEKTTGICTGSIYCDVPLRVSGFIGEFVHDGSVLVVKTHTSDYQWSGVDIEKRNPDDALYGSAILLIRNPFNTFVAERHRTKLLSLMASRKHKRKRGDSSHMNEVGKDQFGTNKEWNKHVYDLGERWKKTILKWLGSAHKMNIPLLIVLYEDLKKDMLTQTVRMLEFLKIDYNMKELTEKLEGGFDEFQRHHSDEFEHYSDTQKAYVRSMITATMLELDSMEIDHKELHLQDYIATFTHKQTEKSH